MVAQGRPDRLPGQTETYCKRQQLLASTVPHLNNHPLLDAWLSCFVHVQRLSILSSTSLMFNTQILFSYESSNSLILAFSPRFMQESCYIKFKYVPLTPHITTGTTEQNNWIFYFIYTSVLLSYKSVHLSTFRLHSHWEALGICGKELLFLAAIYSRFCCAFWALVGCF